MKRGLLAPQAKISNVATKIEDDSDASTASTTAAPGTTSARLRDIAPGGGSDDSPRSAVANAAASAGGGLGNSALTSASTSSSILDGMELSTIGEDAQWYMMNDTDRDLLTWLQIDVLPKVMSHTEKIIELEVPLLV